MPVCPECGVAINHSALEGLCGPCLIEQGALLAAAPAVQAEPERSDPPRVFGEYELLEEIARGGMGIVYRARQRNLDRLVAVKRLLFGLQATPESVKRFRGEAAVAASLQHPHIVAIHEVGVHQGEHYLVMDLIDGPNLAKFVKGQPLTSRQAAEYLKKIAEAIHYAHERGVLHRDLKPSNVLIDSDGQPRVTDFGLARRLEGDSSLTFSGHALGSPSYMPPEQAGSTRHKVGRQSDVYSLGATLYHALVGRPPFVGENLNQTLEQVFNREPVSPRLLNPAIARDLETICLKCLEKEPTRRYATAQELAEELDRFLRDEPIRARPAGPAERVWRWCRRKPALATLILLLHVVGVSGVGGIVWEWRQSEQNLYVANVHLANEAMNGHDLVRARELLRAIDHRAVQRAMRGWAWRYLARSAQGEEARILSRHNAWLADLAVSPDRRRLATISEDGVVKLRNLGSEQETTWAAHARVFDSEPDWAHHGAVFTPDGATLITAGEDGAVRGWRVDAAPEKLFEITKLSDPVNRLAMSRDGTLLAGEGENHEVYVWRLNAPTPELLAEFKSDYVVPCGAAFSPDGKTLLAGWADQPIARYDLSAPKAPRKMNPLTGSLPPFAFSPDGKWLATAGPSGHMLSRWTWPGLEPLPVLRVEGGSVDTLAFSPDGRWLAAGLGGGQINLWEVANRETQVANVLHGHEEFVTGLGFAEVSNQLRLASISSDKTVRLWDPASPERSKAILRIGTPVLAVAISPDGLYLATAIRTPAAPSDKEESKTYTLQLWDFRSHAQLKTVVFGAKKDGTAPRIVFAPNSQEVAVTEYARLQFYKVPSLELEGRAGARGLVYAQDGSWFAYITGTGVAKRSSLAAPEQMLVARIGGLQQLALSPNGRTLAGSEESGARIWLWDAQDGHLLSQPLSGHTLRITGLAFTADGQTMVSGGWDGRLGLWNIKRRQNLAFLRGHNNYFNQLAISPDGGTVATGGDDSVVRLWNVARCQEIAVLQGHDDILNDLAFSSDRRWLATASNDGTVRLWHAPLLAEIEAAEKGR